MQGPFYYHMSKAAMDSMTIHLAGNLIKQGVRVKTIKLVLHRDILFENSHFSPGVVVTDFTGKLGFDDAAQKAVSFETFRDEHSKSQNSAALRPLRVKR